MPPIMVPVRAWPLSDPPLTFATVEACQPRLYPSEITLQKAVHICEPKRVLTETLASLDWNGRLKIFKIDCSGEYLDELGSGGSRV